MHSAQVREYSAVGVLPSAVLHPNKIKDCRTAMKGAVECRFPLILVLLHSSINFDNWGSSSTFSAPGKAHSRVKKQFQQHKTSWEVCLAA